jgi:hypothetical protein
MEPQVNIRQTNMEISTICLQYLSFHCFDNALTDEEISLYVNQGYYSFQDFATTYWPEYLQSCVNAIPQHSFDDLDHLSLIIDRFMGRHLRDQVESDKLSQEVSSSTRQGQIHRIFRQMHLLQLVTKSQMASAKCLPSIAYHFFKVDLKDDDPSSRLL